MYSLGWFWEYDKLEADVGKGWVFGDAKSHDLQIS